MKNTVVQFTAFSKHSMQWTSAFIQCIHPCIPTIRNGDKWTVNQFSPLFLFKRAVSQDVGRWMKSNILLYSEIITYELLIFKLWSSIHNNDFLNVSFFGDRPTPWIDNVKMSIMCCYNSTWRSVGPEKNVIYLGQKRALKL